MEDKKFKVGDKVKILNTDFISVFGKVLTLNSNDAFIILDNTYCCWIPLNSLKVVEENITDNGECKMPVEKEEFKIDKVGHYYRQRNGDLAKILHISKNNMYEPVTFLDTDDFVGSCSLKGERFDYTTEKFFETQTDIIEYIGPELPKELREFKFEGYLCEFPSMKIMSLRDNAPMANILGYRISDIYDTKEYTQKRLNEIKIDGGFISKWEVTMKEIIE